MTGAWLGEVQLGADSNTTVNSAPGNPPLHTLPGPSACTLRRFSVNFLTFFPNFSQMLLLATVCTLLDSSTCTLYIDCKKLECVTFHYRICPKSSREMPQGCIPRLFSLDSLFAPPVPVSNAVYGCVGAK